jgi:hypothetical protein
MRRSPSLKSNGGAAALERNPGFSAWGDIEVQGTAWPEPMGWPTRRYDGTRESLDLPDHLKDADDLRQLPPDNLIGFFVFKRNNRNLREKDN